MRIALLLGLVALSGASPVLAQGSPVASTPVAAPQASDIRDMAPVVVSGVQPGPGMWKVSKGEHVLWILGTVSPVPRKMEWYSPQVEAALAQSQEIIGPPGIVTSIGVGGMFKMAFAVPTLLRARKNPDGKMLREVLPPDLYARWSALKPVYLGRDQSVEEWRPIFAVSELYQAAIKRAGLVAGTGVGARISELAKQHKIKRTSTLVEYEVKDPKGLAKSFARAEVDDVACFRSALDQLEQDVAQAAQRANAWALGDLQALARPHRRGAAASCFEAVAKTEAARSLGADDAYTRTEAQWLQAVDAALAGNHTSFATLPLSYLLEADGLLARLQVKGYTVEAPE